jgi:hypothetical protein
MKQNSKHIKSLKIELHTMAYVYVYGGRETNPTWTDPSVSLGLHGGGPVTSRLSHGMASSLKLI